MSTRGSACMRTTFVAMTGCKPCSHPRPKKTKRRADPHALKVLLQQALTTRLRGKEPPSGAFGRGKH